MDIKSVIKAALLKQSNLGGAGEYFQRREEQGAIRDELALRTGLHNKYPNDWSPSPLTGRREQDLTKVPAHVARGYKQQLDEIDRKWNGNLFGANKRRDLFTQDRLDEMGFKMLPKATPESLSELYKIQMQKDWNTHINDALDLSTPSNKFEDLDSFMSKRWGVNWKAYPRPQTQQK